MSDHTPYLLTCLLTYFIYLNLTSCTYTLFSPSHILLFSPVSDITISYSLGAIVALSVQSDQSDLGAREWLSILRALAQKTITTGATAALLGSFSTMDEEGEANQELLMQHILQGSSSMENLIRLPKCSIGDRMIIGDYPEIGSPLSSTNQIIGLGEGHPNGFPILTSTSTSVSGNPSASASSSAIPCILPSSTSSTSTVVADGILLSNNSNNSISINSNLVSGNDIVKSESSKSSSGKKRSKAKMPLNTPVAKKQKR